MPDAAGVPDTRLQGVVLVPGILNVEPMKSLNERLAQHIRVALPEDLSGQIDRDDDVVLIVAGNVAWSAKKLVDYFDGPPPIEAFNQPAVRTWLTDLPDFGAHAFVESTGRVVGCHDADVRGVVEDWQDFGLLGELHPEPCVAVAQIEGQARLATPTFIGVFNDEPTIMLFTFDAAAAKDDRTRTDFRLLHKTAEILGYQFVPMIAGVQWKTPALPTGARR